MHAAKALPLHHYMILLLIQCVSTCLVNHFHIIFNIKIDKGPVHPESALPESSFTNIYALFSCVCPDILSVFPVLKFQY